MKGMVTDLNTQSTELQEAWKILRDNEAKFGNVLEHSPLGRSLTQLDGMLNADQTYCDILGYSEDEIKAKNWKEITHPEDILKIDQVIQALLDGKTSSTHLQKRFIHKNGNTIWADVTVSLQRDESGKPLYFLTTIGDITTRKLAEYEAHKIQALLKKTQALTKIGGWEYTVATQHVFWTEEVYRLHGVSNDFDPSNPDENIKFYAPEDQKIITDAFHSAVEEGTPYDLELRLINASGAELWVHTIGKAEKIDGKIVRVWGSIIDITERKQDEAKIIRVSRLYATISHITQAIMFSKDRESLFAEICRVAVVHGKFRMAWIGILDEAHGYVEAVVFAGEEQGYLKNININIYDPILGLEPTSTAIRERRTILCQDIANDPNMAPWREQALQRGYLSSASIPIQKNGRPIGVLALYESETPGFSVEDQGLLDEIAKDISYAVDSLDSETKRKQAEEEIRLLNADLEHRVAERTAELVKASRVKDEFLTTISHELRTPLTSILGMSEMLLEQRRDPLSPSQQKSIQVIESSSSHLLELINDILDLSKVEAGKLDYFPEVIAVEPICRTSLAFVKDAAVKKSITLSYQPTPQVFNMYADPRRLKQILINLLNNAVKFTPKNGTVTLQVTGDVEGDRIQFSVMDTGIGIAAEDLKKLFKPFTQLDTRLNREYEGTGLGLAIVQKLTNLHGGSVAVESGVGKGSRFTINLRWGKDIVDQQSILKADVEPMLRQTENPLNDPLQPPLANGIVLLAEDNLFNNLTVRNYLENYGYQVVVAHDGLEALEKAEEVQPHIILMDIQMPVLDGLEAISRLRTDPRFASTPIIAHTALAMPGDRERCLEAGANEYLSKPVSLKLLVKTVESMLNPRKASSEQ